MTAVALREIGDRWQVLAAAAVAGLTALAAPLLPGVTSGAPGEARFMFAFIAAVAFVVAVGWSVGSGAISAELSAGRMGFLFARPLSGPAIWTGKMAGAFIAVLASGLLVLAPTMAVSVVTATWPGGWPVGDVIVGVLALSVAVVAVAHPVAFLWRTRSPWLLADLVALVLVAATIAASLLTLLRTGSAEAVVVALDSTAAVVLLTLLAAGAAQVIRGRCGVREGHRVLSLTLWGVTAAYAVALASSTWWFVHVGPSDLDEVGTVATSARGPWAAISGPAAHRPGYHPTFLLDTGTGRWVPAASHTLYDSLSFSDDGSRAAWLAVDFGLRRTVTVLGVATLAPGAPAVVRTPMEELPSAARITVAPSGEVAALVEDDTVSVLSLPSLDIVAAVHLPGDARARWPAFLDDGTVAVLSFSRERGAPTAAVDVATFDPASRRLTPRSGFELAAEERWVTGPRIHPATRHMLSVAPADDGVALVLSDLLTGTRVAVLERAAKQARIARARFLSDGRVAVAAQRDDGYHLLLFGSDGAPLLDRPLPPADGVGLGAEYVRGSIAVSLLKRDGAGRASRRAIGVDLSSGAVAAIGNDLRIANPAFLWRSADIAEVIGTGTPASRLFAGSDGTLYLLETGTGELRPLT